MVGGGSSEVIAHRPAHPAEWVDAFEHYFDCALDGLVIDTHYVVLADRFEVFAGVALQTSALALPPGSRPRTTVGMSEEADRWVKRICRGEQTIGRSQLIHAVATNGRVLQRSQRSVCALGVGRQWR